MSMGVREGGPLRAHLYVYCGRGLCTAIGLCLYVASLLLREPSSTLFGRLWLAPARMLRNDSGMQKHEITWCLKIAPRVSLGRGLAH